MSCDHQPTTPSPAASPSAELPSRESLTARLGGHLERLSRKSTAPARKAACARPDGDSVKPAAEPRSDVVDMLGCETSGAEARGSDPSVVVSGPSAHQGAAPQSAATDGDEPSSTERGKKKAKKKAKKKRRRLTYPADYKPPPEWLPTVRLVDVVHCFTLVTVSKQHNRDF